MPVAPTASEDTIAAGLQMFVAVGQALLTIRDQRLYRQDYATFEDYCRERWGLTHRHANRLIQAAEVVENVGPIGPIPLTESQARPLTRLAPSEQRAAWREAVTTAPPGKLTAAHVQAVVRQHRTKSPPPIDLHPPGEALRYLQYWWAKAPQPERAAVPNSTVK